MSGDEAAAEARYSLPFALHHAFIIGIDAYQRVTPLHTAVNDARQVAQTLREQQHFLVHPPLLDAKAAEILTLLDTTVAQLVGTGDRVFFYYAGHGVALDGEDGPAGYLVPADADPADVKTLISMAHLRRALEALPCRHLLLVLDCCFSGAFKWSSATRAIGTLMPKTIYKERFDRFVQDPAWQVITSAAYDQTALDVVHGKATGARGTSPSTDGTPHSPFARALFEGIGGAADLKGATEGNGIITATELYCYIRDRVEPESLEAGVSQRQTPGFFPLAKQDKGEFIFLDPHHRLNLPPIPRRSPYKGLKSFDESDQLLFYGRERVIKELRDMAPGHKLLVITGASGTGKSSVVKAGLLPALRASGLRILPVIRPGEHPLAVLEQALAQAHAAVPGGIAGGVCAGGPGAPAGSASLSAVLMIDQFEELITRCTDEDERRRFDARLRQAIDEDPVIRQCIVTVRADFEPLLAGGALQTYWMAGRYAVPPFSLEELREVVLLPTYQEVLIFDPPRLVDDIIADVVQSPGALPLLSYALSELYEAYCRSGRQDRALTKGDFDNLGGVIGALHTKADTLYRELPPGEQETMRKIMLRMVSVEGELAGRRVPMADLVYSPAESRLVDVVIEKLVDARLIVRGGDYIEPAHDALVRAWSTLREWIQEVGTDKLILGAELNKAAGKFARSRDLKFLWNHNPNLPVLQSELGNARQWFNAGEIAFIRESLARRKRGVRIARGVTALVIVALSVTAAIAWQQDLKAQRETIEAQRQTVEAQRQTAKARAQTLLVQAKNQLRVDNDLVVLLAVEAVKVASSLPGFHASDFESLLLESLSVRGQALLTLGDAGKSRVSIAVWEPGSGGHIVTTSLDDGMVRVWDAKSGRMMGRCSAGPANFAAWSPNGRVFVVGGTWAKVSHLLDAGEVSVDGAPCGGTPIDGYLVHAAWSPQGDRFATAHNSSQGGPTVAVWDSAGARQPYLEGHAPRSTVNDVEWNADGTRIVTAGADGTARVWDAAKNHRYRQMAIEAGLPAAGSDVRSAAFSPDGRLIVSALADGTAREWDAASGSELTRLTGHRGPLNGAAWNRDGTRIVTVSGDRTARIWDARSGALQTVLAGHAGPVVSAIWNSTGTVIVTAGADGTARVWDAASGEQRTLLAGHRGPVAAAAWSPDRGLVLTASDDGTARVWDPEDQGPFPVIDYDRAHGRRTAAWNRDETRILTAGDANGVVMVSDAGTGRLVLNLVVPGGVAAHQGGARAAAWSPDERRILTAGRDGMVRVWDAAHGSLLFGFQADGSAKHTVNLAQWSPTGDRILTAGEDRMARVWRVQGTGVAQPPMEFQLAGVVLHAAWNKAGTRIVSTQNSAPYVEVLDVDERSGAGMGGHRELQGHDGQVWYAAWSPDDRRLATADNNGVVNVYAADGDQPLTTMTHQVGVRHLAWNSTGTRIATASEDKIARIWDPDRAGSKPLELRGHGAAVRHVAWSPDDRLLVTAGDQTARVWNSADGNSVVILNGHLGEVSFATWNRTGTLVLSAGDDGTARVHPIALAAMLDAACRRVSRNMTPDEWQLYMGPTVPRRTCPEKSGA